MPVFTDQLGNHLHLNNLPSRIVSLVPSQTELLFDLGLQQEVVGITKFCIHPQHWFRSKKRVGGTKNVNPDIIHQLKPDLIIANKEENTQADIEALQQYYSVWISDISNLQQTRYMIHEIGLMTGKENKAKEIIQTLQTEFDLLLTYTSALINKSVAYLIWREPYITVGGDTFISHMLQCCGLKNIFENKTRYPIVTIEQLQTAKCELLLLSSEPYPFKQKHINELQQHLPATKIILVDGEMFSWYGSRVLQAPAYFKNLIRSLTI